MATARLTHITLPADLVTRIDKLVGTCGRSTFLAQLPLDEVRRRELIKILEDPEPIWKNEDHPDIAALGSAEWVRRQRCHRPGEDAELPPPLRRRRQFRKPARQR